jgi:hypothetical protein
MSKVKDLEVVKAHNINAADLSRSCGIIAQFMPEVITCQDNEVIDHVLKFVNEYPSVSAAYEALQVANGKREPKVPGEWDVFSAFATVVRTARKHGIDPHEVQLKFEAALREVYGATTAEPQAA